jgi:hypothetical protein
MGGSASRSSEETVSPGSAPASRWRSVASPLTGSGTSSRATIAVAPACSMSAGTPPAPATSPGSRRRIVNQTASSSGLGAATTARCSTPAFVAGDGEPSRGVLRQFASGDHEPATADRHLEWSPRERRGCGVGDPTIGRLDRRHGSVAVVEAVDGEPGRELTQEVPPEGSLLVAHRSVSLSASTFRRRAAGSIPRPRPRTRDDGRRRHAADRHHQPWSPRHRRGRAPT